MRDAAKREAAVGPEVEEKFKEAMSGPNQKQLEKLADDTKRLTENHITKTQSLMIQIAIRRK